MITYEAEIVYRWRDGMMEVTVPIGTANSFDEAVSLCIDYTSSECKVRYYRIMYRQDMAIIDFGSHTDFCHVRRIDGKPMVYDKSSYL